MAKLVSGNFASAGERLLTRAALSPSRDRTRALASEGAFSSFAFIPSRAPWLWLCVLMLSVPCAPAQTVEGSVFDAATGAGVGGVKVELLKGSTAFYETTTDGGGRFRFDDVRAADYAARYQSPDYFSTAGPSDYRTFRVDSG